MRLFNTVRGRRDSATSMSTLALLLLGRHSMTVDGFSSSVVLSRPSHQAFVTPMSTNRVHLQQPPAFKSPSSQSLGRHVMSMMVEEHDETRNASSLSVVEVEVQNSHEKQAIEPFEQPKQPVPVLMKLLQSLLPDDKSIRPMTQVLATVVLVSSLLFSSLSPAWAAGSGGRMGGSFGGAPSYSRSVPSRSYSAPRSSYGGGFRSSYGYGYSAPPVIVSPWAGGYGYGYGSPGVTVVSGGGGLLSGITNIFFFGVFFWVLSNVFTSFLSNDTAYSSSIVETGALGPGVSVAQISVALDVPNRDDPSSILSYLKRLSQTAETDQRVGLQNVVSQVALQLLREKRSIRAANTKSRHFNSLNQAQREYQMWSVKERSKFDKETVSNYGGVDYSDNANTPLPPGATSTKATSAVVTLVLAIQGDSTQLPKTIRGVKDVEEALSRIATDVKVADCLVSAEVLWTPEERTETLSMRDVIADYPELRTV